MAKGNPMTGTIIISRSEEAKCWLAKHTNPLVFELFGTDTLPTAFTTAASEARVIESLQKLNPNATVILATRSGRHSSIN